MENKITSRVCNLVFNIMYAPLKLVVYQLVGINMLHATHFY